MRLGLKENHSKLSWSGQNVAAAVGGTTRGGYPAEGHGLNCWLGWRSLYTVGKAGWQNLPTVWNWKHSWTLLSDFSTSLLWGVNDETSEKSYRGVTYDWKDDICDASSVTGAHLWHRSLNMWQIYTVKYWRGYFTLDISPALLWDHLAQQKCEPPSRIIMFSKSKHVTLIITIFYTMSHFTSHVTCSLVR